MQMNTKSDTASIPLAFSNAPVPQNLTGAERQEKYRNAHPERVGATRRRYEETHGTVRSDAQYLSKPFCAWDGEGYTERQGAHIYNLFAGKCGDDTISITDDDGLPTERIFNTLLDFSDAHPDAIHIIYGGSYDFNMWMSDISKADVRYIYTHKFGRWKNFRISWRRGKSFYVCRVDDDGKKIGMGVTVYDVVSFFQSSFVSACDSYLGDRFLHRDMIVANKQARGSFTTADNATVAEYNDAELDNLILLANELRERLNKVHLRPRRWDSCGAIASALLTQHGIKQIIKGANTPPEVQEASRFAYAGGRFELIKFGHSDNPVYEYEVNSAYPSALRDVPDLSKGYWEYVSGDPGAHPFAVYHIESHTVRQDIPAPLFRRDGNGSVCYPQHVMGWYWSPEYNIWTDYVRMGLSSGRVEGAWIFREATDNRPFSFIEPLYNKRRALKKAKDGAHVGIKLGLNSLYGKLAQQVGAEDLGDKGWRLPPFHCLEWAGYTTSHCRAAVLSAVINDLDSVIAFETDAVFTTRPLDVKVGSNLGDFDRLDFENMTYVQSGLYFADSAEGPIAKTRGVDRGELTREQIMGQMNARYAVDRTAPARLTRFVGVGVALMQGWWRWRRWETITKNMTLEPTGKRIHIECESCDRNADRPMVLGKWHHTFCPMMNMAHSLQFPIMWANPDPNMTELAEMRESENGWTD